MLSQLVERLPKYENDMVIIITKLTFIIAFPLDGHGPSESQLTESNPAAKLIIMPGYRNKMPG